MSFTYSVHCGLCTSVFKSVSALSKHMLSRHGRVHDANRPRTFTDEEGKDFKEIPTPKTLTATRRKAYNDWLSVVAERFNGSHHPKFEGKPIQYLSYKREHQIEKQLIG